MLFTTYWAGYLKSNVQLRTTDIPENVDIVILAFGGPNPDSSLDMSFMIGTHSEEQLKAGIVELRERGTKVLLSLLDRPEMHWNNVDLDVFTSDVAKTVRDWGLDGIDIDAESGMDSEYVNTFVSLIKRLHQKLPSNALLTYTCYEGTQGPDGDILAQVLEMLSFVQLMAYFLNTEAMKALFRDYNTIVPKHKLLIGVKAGEPQGTSLDEVRYLNTWTQLESIGGMMLWTINRDIPTYTNLPKGTFAKCIKKKVITATWNKHFCVYSHPSASTTVLFCPFFLAFVFGLAFVVALFFFT